MQRALLRAVVIAGASVAMAATAGAQGRGRSSTNYPPGFRPPPGMCRVWVRGVPPGQQPGVTDCATARASASANATVLYGDRNDDPSYRGRTGTYTRTAYDSYGNRVTQTVRRNADGSISVVRSTPYPYSGSTTGKTLPGTTNGQVYNNGQGYNNGQVYNNGQMRGDDQGNGHGNGRGNGHGKNHKDHGDENHDHR